MPRGGPPTYTYTLPAVYLAVPGTTILATQHNTPLEDIEDVLNEPWPGYLIQWTVPTGDVLSLPNGSAAAPSLTFTDDTDVGLYRIGANNLGVAVNGAKVLDVATTGLGVTGTVTSSGAVKPSANDGAALGASGTAWADAFLASGGVINFDAGNYTLTHTAGVLTANGAFSVGTANPITAGTLELGAASDTTISRGAAGFIAVESNRVPSPPSQAAGDTLYRGATEWERLAKGTASQVLAMNAGATAPEWVTPVAGGMTLLDTLTTTSGTTQTSSTIAAGYKSLYVEFDRVSTGSSNMTMLVALSSTNGSAYGAAKTFTPSIASAANGVGGALWIYNIGSTLISAKSALGITGDSSGSAATALAILPNTDTAAVVNKIQFTAADGGTGTFDAGTIRIYGVR